MSSIPAGQGRITTAIQATATTWWSTQVAPGDFASGTASTSWPATAINVELNAGWPIAYRTAMAAHLVGIINQTAAQARRATNLSPTQRQDSLAYAGLLLAAYEPSARPGALTV